MKIARFTNLVLRHPRERAQESDPSVFHSEPPRLTPQPSDMFLEVGLL